MVADSTEILQRTDRAVVLGFSSARALARSTFRGVVLTAAVAIAVMVFATRSVAQTPAVPAVTPATRTPCGDPDLQGVWDFRTLTPIERPVALAGKQFLTPDEAAAIERNVLDGRSSWWDYGTALVEDRRTSLIVSPSDGTIPWAPDMRARIANFNPPYLEGPEDRSLAERCLVGFNSGPPMLPSAYNNNLLVLQTPDYVVILNEMIHST